MAPETLKVEIKSPTGRPKPLLDIGSRCKKTAGPRRDAWASSDTLYIATYIYIYIFFSRNVPIGRPFPFAWALSSVRVEGASAPKHALGFSRPPILVPSNGATLWQCAFLALALRFRASEDCNDQELLLLLPILLGLRLLLLVEFKASFAIIKSHEELSQTWEFP